MILQLEHVTVRYGAHVAMDDLSLECEGGGVGLLGPNGAGKSTMIKAVLGLVPPASGRIRVLGHPVPAEQLEVRRKVGYMPESPSYFPGLTGFENVAYAGQISGMPRGEARRRAHEVLEYVGIDEERYRPVEDYSTGMRQKAKLAAALVHDPDLLLLDEPTNGLDPKGRVEVLQLIRDLSAEKGLHVLLSSHLLADVEAVCDSILVMVKGRLRAAGELQALKQHQGGSRVRLTIPVGAEPFARAATQRGWEVEPIDPLDPSDCVVSLPEGVAAREVLALASEVGCTVRRFVPRAVSLEEVFLEHLREES